MSDAGSKSNAPPRQLFRSAAVAHFQSGQELRVAAPRIGFGLWALLLAAILIAAASVIWACAAEIPVTVESYGILLETSGVARVQSSSLGQVTELRASRNQFVSRGDILAVLRLGEIESQLEAANTRLDIALAADERLARGEERQLMDERVLTAKKTERLTKSMESIRELLAGGQELQNASLNQQAMRLDDVRNRSASLLDEFQVQQDALLKLAGQQLATLADLNQMRTAMLDAFTRVTELDNRQAAVELERLQLRRSEVDTKGQLTELQTALDDLQASLQRLELQTQRAQRARKDEIESLRTDIAATNDRIETQRYLRAPASGKLLELTVEIGNTVQPGQVVASIARSSLSGSAADASTTASPTLVVTAFFPLAAGKRISFQDQALVTPTTVKRERFGSIHATVTDVSTFPISLNEATRLVGNQEILSPLAKMGGVIGIQAQLERDEAGRLDWTSGDDPIAVDAGTSVSIQVVVERRRPISYLLPMLYKAVYGPQKTNSAGELP